MRNLTRKDLFNVAIRDDFTCQYCGDKPGFRHLQIDHLVPVALGGSDNEANLVAACKKCNGGKSDLVLFPPSKIIGPDQLNPSWSVHRSYGSWEIKIHRDHGVVLEFTPYGYWIDGHRAHDKDWEWHIIKNEWPEPHNNTDFLEALSYFRKLIAKPSSD